MSELDWAHGAWMGDGSTTVTHGRRYWCYTGTLENVEKFKFITGWTGVIVKDKRRKDLYTVKSRRYDRVSYSTENSHTKRLPSYVYLLEESRKWEFIQGLLDTDGSINSRGDFSYSSCSPGLVLDLALLFSTLGVFTRVIRNRDKRYNDYYMYMVTTTKWEIYRTPLRKYTELSYPSKCSVHVDCDYLRLKEELYDYFGGHITSSVAQKYNLYNLLYKVNGRHPVTEYSIEEFVSRVGVYSGPYMESLYKSMRRPPYIKFTEEVFNFYKENNYLKEELKNEYDLD